jgi:riboflavin kinase / FMN adenylyltransferase
VIEVIEVMGTPPLSQEPQILAIGKFDGVHIGHQEILRVARSQVDAKRIAVMSFWPHPAWALSRKSGYDRALTPKQEQARLLEALGVDRQYRVEFTKEYAGTSAEQFVEEHLAVLNLRGIVVGVDFTFGKGGAAKANDLARYTERIGVPVHVVNPVEENGLKVSSSQVRTHLESGRVEAAEALLGRPYSIVGQVAHGQELGRKLGFPTANLEGIDPYVMPAAGVYAVSVQVHNDGNAVAGGGDGTSQTWFGVMNAGYRPTVDGTRFQAEVHLLDFSGDLYGQSLRVSFLGRVRDERKFPSLDALTAQIQADTRAVRTLFGL